MSDAPQNPPEQPGKIVMDDETVRRIAQSIDQYVAQRVAQRVEDALREAMAYSDRQRAELDEKIEATMARTKTELEAFNPRP